MKRLSLLVIGLALLWPGVVLAEDEDPNAGSVDVETPAEALQRATPLPEGVIPTQPDAMHFDGGVLVVERPDSDLYESLPVGSAADFRRRGYEVVRADKVEMVVDGDGTIYRDRNYQGIIPGIRDAFDKEKMERLSRRNHVGWVGFQPMAAISRIFWQLTAPDPQFEVNRIDDYTLEVFFPKARFHTSNLARRLWTNAFGGPVKSIDGQRARRGVRYIVKLKEPTAAYLYRFEAPFLYLDFERANDAPVTSGGATP